MSIFHGFNRFVKDMMSGGGDLNKHIVPSEIRRMAPKEAQPGGFDPARDWLGFDIKADPAHEAKVRDQQATAAAQADYAQGAQPLRGMSGPQSVAPVGLLAAQMTGPYNQQAQQAQFSGPYNQQAQQLAGLPYGMAYGMPNQIPTTPVNATPGTTYDNPMRTFRLVGGIR